MKQVIKVNSISKEFIVDNVQKTQALNNISFEVFSGDIVFVIGSNGSGKSTLLSILSNIIKPTMGEVEIIGSVVSILDIGSNFSPDLTGRENVKMFFSVNFYKGDKTITQLCEEVLSLSNLGEFFDRSVKSYSKGMFLRLSFSTAFLLDADIYILDEIISAGDEAFRSKSQMLINDLIKRKKTIIIATHEINEALYKSNICLWLEQGEVKLIDKASNVIKEYLQFQSIKLSKELKDTKFSSQSEKLLFLDEKFELFFKDNTAENENIILKSIKLYNVPKKSVLIREEDIVIDILVFKLKKEIELSCAIKIRNVLQHPVLHLVSFGNEDGKQIIKSQYNYTGLMSFKVIIPKVLLTSGQYFLSLYFGKNTDAFQPNFNERAFYLASEIVFNINNKELEHISDPIHYSIQPNFKWQINNVY